MRTTRLPTSPTCPSCDALLSGATNPEGTDSPRPGDVTVCIYCAAVLTFTARFGLRMATPADLADPRVRASVDLMVRAVRQIQAGNN